MYDEIDRYILSNLNKTNKEIALFLKIHPQTVSRRLKGLNLNKKTKYNINDINFLKQYWPNGEISTILEYFSLTDTKKNRYKIYKLCYKNNIKRNVKNNGDKNRKCDLSWMIEDSLETFYWIGFILADGHIGNDSLNISICDKLHLEKLGKLCNVNISIRKKNNKKWSKTFSIFCRHKRIIEIFRKRFDINNNKTYNPPDTNKWNFKEDQLLALFIGFIDGDGHIKFNSTKNINITIGCHSSWYYVLDFFSSILIKNNFNIKKVSFCKKGYVHCRFSTKPILFLANFIKNNNLPVLERKWKNILKLINIQMDN